MQSRDGAYMRSAAQDNRGDWNNQGWDNRGGFWPGAVARRRSRTAGAVAATAVGTAGAIATAPFGGPYYRDSYAYGPGYVDTYNYNGVAMPQSPNLRRAKRLRVSAGHLHQGHTEHLSVTL